MDKKGEATLTTVLGVRLNPVGLILAIAYSILVSALIVIIEFSTPQDPTGLGWTPVLLLSFPWFLIGLFIPGLILNVGVAYTIGMLLHRLWRRLLSR